MHTSCVCAWFILLRVFSDSQRWIGWVPRIFLFNCLKGYQGIKNKQMKNNLLLFMLIIFGSSCVRRIGDLTLISTRNIDSKVNYVELKRYVKGKGKTVEMAIYQAIKTVNGGEFMKNVIIYSNGEIEGDVWGIAFQGMNIENKDTLTDSKSLNKADEKAIIRKQEELAEAEIKAGFNVGDKVTWKDASKFNIVRTGIITAKIEKYAVIKIDKNRDVVKIKYKILQKIN